MVMVKDLGIYFLGEVYFMATWMVNIDLILFKFVQLMQDHFIAIINQNPTF